MTTRAYDGKQFRPSCVLRTTPNRAYQAGAAARVAASHPVGHTRPAPPTAHSSCRPHPAGGRAPAVLRADVPALAVPAVVSEYGRHIRSKIVAVPWPGWVPAAGPGRAPPPGPVRPT